MSSLHPAAALNDVDQESVVSREASGHSFGQMCWSALESIKMQSDSLSCAPTVCATNVHPSQASPTEVVTNMQHLRLILGRDRVSGSVLSRVPISSVSGFSSERYMFVPAHTYPRHLEMPCSRCLKRKRQRQNQLDGRWRIHVPLASEQRPLQNQWQNWSNCILRRLRVQRR